MRGSSTLEILIAFAVMALALTAAVSLLFGNQSLAADIEGSTEALSRAQAVLEDAKAQARYDFNALNSTTSLSVVSIGEYAKRATAEVSWESLGRHLSVSLSTDITNPEGAETGESCSSVLAGDWTQAALGTAVAVGTSTIDTVSAMRSAGGRLYLTTHGTHAGDQDFFVYDITHVPAFVGSIDANSAAAGINGLAIASTSSGFYIYAASDSKPEIEVLNVSAAKPKVVARYLMPTSTTPFVVGGHANTVLYKGGYLYVGLSKATSGPEFVVLDAASPSALAYAGSYDVDAGISDIKVAHGVAYLATADNTKEVLAFDVSDPHTPRLISNYHPPGSSSFGAGQALALVGSTLYLGRSYDNLANAAPEWYSIDVSNPAAPKRISSLDIGTSTANPQSVNGVVVRDTLAFTAARDSLQLWSIATATAPALYKKINLAAIGSRETAIACAGNTVYIGGYRTADSKGVLYSFAP